jgi:hypothetical protein
MSLTAEGNTMQTCQFKRLSLSLIAMTTLASGCVSTPKGPEFEADRVVQRMEGKEETPDFATGAKAMWTEGDQVFFANITSMAGDSRPEACMKAAETDARVGILKYISENITSSGQVSEANADNDPGFESLTAFLTQGKLSGITVSERYWDRREQSRSSGERALRVHCAVKIAINKTQLAKQLREATTNVKSGDPEIRQKLLDAQKNFLDGI